MVFVTFIFGLLIGGAVAYSFGMLYVVRNIVDRILSPPEFNVPSWLDEELDAQLRHAEVDHETKKRTQKNIKEEHER